MQDPLPATQQALNEAAIRDLADETGQPIHHVRTAYEEEFAVLRAMARIPDYVVLFTIRRTRKRLATCSKSP